MKTRLVPTLDRLNHFVSTRLFGWRFSIVPLLLLAMLALPACSHSQHYRYGRTTYSDSYSYDGYGDITRAYYRYRDNRRGRRQYYNRLNRHYQEFWRSLDDHHNRYHRRRGHQHRFGDSRYDDCRRWETRWRRSGRSSYYDDYGRGRRNTYGSVTLGFYQNRGRRTDFYAGLDLHLQGFWRALGNHHNRYHEPYGTTHQYGGYDSGICYEFDQGWGD